MCCCDIDLFRHSWQQEKAKLLGRLDDEEVRVRGLMTDIDYVKNHSKKVSFTQYTITCIVNSTLKVLCTNVCIYCGLLNVL